MKKSSYIGFYLVFAGIALLVLLIKTLITEEGTPGRFPGSFYIAAEFIMCALSVAGGFLLVMEKTGGRRLSLFSLGMMLYSVANSAGYYWKTHQQKLLVLFILLIILSVAAFIILMRNRIFVSTYKGPVNVLRDE